MKVIFYTELFIRWHYMTTIPAFKEALGFIAESWKFIQTGCAHSLRSDQPVTALRGLDTGLRVFFLWTGGGLGGGGGGGDGGGDLGTTADEVGFLFEEAL